MMGWSVRVNSEVVGLVIAIDQWVACRMVKAAWGYNTFELFPID